MDNSEDENKYINRINDAAVWSISANVRSAAVEHLPPAVNPLTPSVQHILCVGRHGPYTIKAKFHYTDTDTAFFCGETDPHGPNGVSPQKKSVSVSVSV